MLEKKLFTTTQSDLLQYSGTVVQVLGELDEKEYDKEDVGIMYNIMTADGTSLQAFGDELSPLE